MLLEPIYKQLSPLLSARRWLVAFSGGVDSHVLLHLLTHFLQQHKGAERPELVALHINHQLQTEATQWAKHCQRVADSLGVSLQVIDVEVSKGPRESLEDKARQARYQAFEAELDMADVLFLGHHQDDQVETLMLRLLRGSGSRGASAMPHSRPLGHGRLYRPLLDIPRTTIEAYASKHRLTWVEDPSNQQSDFDRNFLRLKLLPLMAERWPQYRQTLARAAALNEESAQLNEELAELDFHGLSLSPEYPSIPLSALTELSAARQKNLLRYWFQVRELAMPSATQLQAVLDDVVNARRDAEPLLSWPGVQIRRFKDALYAMRPLPEFDKTQVLDWDLSEPVAIAGVGCLSARSVIGNGMHLQRLQQVQQPEVTLRFRRGGERCQPTGRGGSQSLKKLLQEYNVETWQRDRLPLLYCGDELVAVSDLWVCEGWEAGANEQGLALHWQPVK